MPDYLVSGQVYRGLKKTAEGSSVVPLSLIYKTCTPSAFQRVLADMIDKVAFKQNLCLKSETDSEQSSAIVAIHHIKQDLLSALYHDLRTLFTMNTTLAFGTSVAIDWAKRSK